MSTYYFTSESVTRGHPDKLCDLIADAILDEILRKDKNARVACEVVCSTGFVLITGEVSTNCYVAIAKIARDVIKNVGYCNASLGFDYRNCAVFVEIDEQSRDIARGVNGFDRSSLELGAGDQGLVFGYACNQTEDFLPMPIYLAHKLAQRLDKVRTKNVLPYLGPDGKTQVTLKFENGKPVRVAKVVVSAQHSEEVTHDEIVADIKKHVIFNELPKNFLDDSTEFYINSTGRFVHGGPAADCGLTGRKLMVDTYGGFARHGGGAFSGKDPTKVDRSGAYMARYIAKNIVAANLAQQCEVQLAFAIGISRPLSVFVECFGSSNYSNFEFVKAIKNCFDLSVSSIIKNFDLLNLNYKQLACYGHFGRAELNLPWERLDRVNDLKSYFGLL